MKCIRCYINTMCRIVTVVGITIAAWKFVRFWRSGLAKKTGHNIDSSVSAAAKTLEKAAIALESQADRGLGENQRKGMDEVLIDTKKKLDKATNLVERAINQAN